MSNETPYNEITDHIIERMAERNAQLRRFALRLLDPEDLGHAATHEIRGEARKLLGMKLKETEQS